MLLSADLNLLVIVVPVTEVDCSHESLAHSLLDFGKKKKKILVNLKFGGALLMIAERSLVVHALGRFLHSLCRCSVCMRCSHFCKQK
jgi:hypothetical protein